MDFAERPQNHLEHGTDFGVPGDSEVFDDIGDEDALKATYSIQNRSTFG